MFCMYILWSEKLKKYYVGSTQGLEQRVLYHNSGNVTFTKLGVPWQIVYSEEFETRTDAVRRERQIKSWKSSKSISDLIARAKS